ncbi:MAG: type II toxin-antitoxin system YafQ family toxin [Bacteroidaceae bacterium]|nr:type II toxin-antitoxin system YafQ family toxin [Bacteroidaceae bacterium]
MFIIEQSSRFQKDLKRYSHDKKKLQELKRIINYLEKSGIVPKEHNPHPLKGEYSGAIECHIESDFLLIWIDKTEKTIKLLRLGTHSELFK